MEGIAQPLGAVTLVFTDVEGSTRLLAELGKARYLAALSEHREVVRAAFGHYGGYEVDSQGDSLFYAFASPNGAVEAVLEAMAALEGGPIAIRVGVHTGEPGLDGRNHVGLDVHAAARIMAAGHGGQVLISRATRELLDEALQLRYLGEYRLKDFDRPVQLFQLGEAVFPPLKTVSNTNLPRPPSSFIGRRAEIAEVVALLRAGERVVTLTGPGGSGKTRLAIESATELLADYPVGVFWVPLAALEDSSLVLDTAAEVLGARDGVASRIGEAKLLLVFDNFEHVTGAAGDISSLVRLCPNLSALVTSRELLRIEGEVGFAVPPMSAPEAVELFCKRSRLEPDDAITALCGRLDNTPLAVELAAARTTTLSPREIIERLPERLDLFRGGRDTEARQQTLRATVAWSYDLLSPADQRLFARLGVFAGGCTLDAAEAVCDADLDGLQSLVEKSLVQRSGDRFTMLEAIHDYAYERLVESGEFASLSRRLGQHLLDAAMAFDAERELGRVGAIGALEADLDNIRATLRAAGERADDPLTLRLAHTLAWFWSSSGRRGEGLRWMMEALERGPSAPTVDRVRALESAAAFASLQFDPERTVQFALEALALYRAADDDRGIARTLRWLSRGQDLSGDLISARHSLRESIALCDKLGDRVSLARTLGSLADIERRSRDLPSAKKHFEQSLEIAEALGADGLAADMVESLGWVALNHGDHREASQFFREALRRGSGIDAILMLYCVAGLAAVAALDAQVELAGRLWGAVQAYEEDLGENLQPDLRQVVETALDQLENPGLTDALAEGRQLTIGQAAEEAQIAAT